MHQVHEQDSESALVDGLEYELVALKLIAVIASSNIVAAFCPPLS